MSLKSFVKKVGDKIEDGAHKVTEALHADTRPLFQRSDDVAKGVVNALAAPITGKNDPVFKATSFDNINAGVMSTLIAKTGGPIAASVIKTSVVNQLSAPAALPSSGSPSVFAPTTPTAGGAPPGVSEILKPKEDMSLFSSAVQLFTDVNKSPLGAVGGNLIQSFLGGVSSTKSNIQNASLVATSQPKLNDIVEKPLSAIQSAIFNTATNQPVKQTTTTTTMTIPLWGWIAGGVSLLIIVIVLVVKVVFRRRRR